MRPPEDRFRAVRARTRALIEPLSPEDCALQSMPDTSPAKWHLGHTTWFWETFALQRGVPGYRSFDPAFKVLFNSYYNTIGEQFPRPRRGLLSRPGLDDVLAYREHVDGAMQHWLGAGGAAPPREAALLALGLAHEEQHQELLLTDVKHLFDVNPTAPVYGPALDRPPVARGAAGWLPFDEGAVAIGHEGDGFAFDNESPAHTQWLAPFEIADRLVTNGEFLRFVESGGYDRPEFWLAEGFDAARAAGWRAPAYWRRREGRWWRFGLDGETALHEDEPVAHVSYYEADAFARFSGARLPTEFEWEHACRQAQPRLHGLFDSVWQWTSSSYAPYPGFTPSADAVGEYNGKFMVNQYVLRGASALTAPGHGRPTYRNFFPAAARWQMTGLRLARSPR